MPRKKATGNGVLSATAEQARIDEEEKKKRAKRLRLQREKAKTK